MRRDEGIRSFSEGGRASDATLTGAERARSARGLAKGAGARAAAAAGLVAGAADDRGTRDSGSRTGSGALRASTRAAARRAPAAARDAAERRGEAKANGTPEGEGPARGRRRDGADGRPDANAATRRRLGRGRRHSGGAGREQARGTAARGPLRTQEARPRRARGATGIPARGRGGLAAAQARRNQEASRAAVASAGRRAGARAASAGAAHESEAGVAAVVAGSTSGGVAALPALLAPLLPAAAVVVAVLAILAAVLGVASTPKRYHGTLQGNEAIVAAYLMNEKGLDALHAAAIMGNIVGESNFDPDCCENGDESARDVGTYLGYGICQWTTRSEKQGLKDLAQSMGRDWSDIDVQVAYLGAQLDSWDYSDSYVIVEGDDPPAGTRVSGSRAGFDSATDIADATAQACYGWMNFCPGIPHMSTRVSEAERIYAAIVSGSLGKGAVVEAAQEAAGWEAPYLWGGTDPHGGIDCSGLTQWCYAQAGIDIPHQSEQQRDAGQVVPISEAQPGDILWMPGHVGIYIDPDTCVEATPPRVRMTHGDVASRWTCAVRIG